MSFKGPQYDCILSPAQSLDNHVSYMFTWPQGLKASLFASNSIVHLYPWIAQVDYYTQVDSC